jgi:hypothetical protein
VDLIKRKRQQSDEDEVRMNTITMAKSNEETDESENLAGSHFSRPHWARATTETPVKIGERKETVVALIDHGLEINLMSTEFYKQGRWPADQHEPWLENSSGDKGDGRFIRRLPERKGYDRGRGDRPTVFCAGFRVA